MRALLIVFVGLLASAEQRPGVELIAAQVQALEVDPLAVTERGELSLVLLEAPERALPLEIRVDQTALELDDNRFDWSSVVDPLAVQPRVRARFRAPREPGTYEVRGIVDYSVCDEQWCRRKHGEVRWTVVVE